MYSLFNAQRTLNVFDVINVAHVSALSPCHIRPMHFQKYNLTITSNPTKLVIAFNKYEYILLILILDLVYTDKTKVT